MRDAVRDLRHDHADLNRRVIAIGAAMKAGPSGAYALAVSLDELREALFLHFAREEEGLFPFVAEAAPSLADQVQAMATAHDTICGALARTCHLARTSSDPAILHTLYERFEQAYSAHAASEAQLLARLDDLLDPQQRDRLAALVDAL